MTQVQLYDEDGAPILAPDSGELGILWDSLAAVHDKEVGKETVSESGSFSMDEFFKRLYLARAELDICASALELIGNESGENVGLRAVSYHKKPGNSEKDGFKDAALAKCYSIRQAVAKLRSKASDLAKSSGIEHEIVASNLLKLRTQYRWNIMRITSHRQITLYFDAAVLTPVAAVDISPMLLFRTSSERFMAGEHLNPANLAIIFRDNQGGLVLKLQEANDLFFKNLEISNEHETFLLDCAVESSGAESFDDWNSLLSKARFVLMVRMIIGLVEKEASRNDIVVSEPSGFQIIGKQLRFLWTESAKPSNSAGLAAQFNSWLRAFLTSSGATVNFQ